MVNFDYGLQMYFDESIRVYMKCYAMFIFHDEEDQCKNVLFGPVNANSNVYTDEDFYITLPQNVRKRKLGDVNADIPKGKHKFSFEMIIDPTAHTRKITISMRRLKFFMRPKVFYDISEFATDSLTKLNQKRQLNKKP